MDSVIIGARIIMKNKKYSFPQARDKAKALGYSFTQEGDTIFIETSKLKTSFPTKAQFALWLWYHVKVELEN